MTKHISCSIFLTTIIAFIITIIASPAPSYSLPSTLTVDVSIVNATALTTIAISGQLNVSGMPIQGAHIGIVVDNTNGTHIFADDVITNSTGGYSTFFSLDSSNKGTYQVFASAYTAQAGDLLSTKYFSLGTCLEHWECSDWSQCKPNLKQTRTCTDTNQCGTEDIKPPLSRSCTPTCQMLAGEICSTNQDCSGSFIDASDTERCCETSCRSRGSTGSSSSSSSGGRTTITQTPDNRTTTSSSSSSSSSSSGGSSAPKTNQTAVNTPDKTPDNVTADVQDNKTLESLSNQAASPNTAGDSALTLTGRITGALSSNRWLIIDAILIVFIYIFGRRIFPGNILKTSPPASNKNTGVRQYHKTPEFVYNYNPEAKKSTSIPKHRPIVQHRPSVQQNMQATPDMHAAYSIRKVRVNVSGSRFGRR